MFFSFGTENEEDKDMMWIEKWISENNWERPIRDPQTREEFLSMKDKTKMQKYNGTKNGFGDVKIHNAFYFIVDTKVY